MSGDGGVLTSWAMKTLWLLAAVLVLGCALSPAPSTGAPSTIRMTLPSGKTFETELMINDADRARGLMFRPSLPAGRALLFIFDELDFHGIWMKNCKFPIDILWLDAQHKVVHLAEKVPPCTAKEASDCEVYQPLARANYVVELNAGQARREKALVGSTLEFKLPE